MAFGRRALWLDLALTVVLLVFGLFGTGPAAANQHQPAPPLSYVLVVIANLGMIWWHARPMWTFVVASAATIVYLAAGFAYGPIMITLALAVYGLASRTTVRRTLVATGALLAAGWAAIGIGVAAGERGLTEFVSAAAWLVIPAAVGVALTVRRDASAAVRSEQARRAVSEERLRLAQEVHDVAGHGFAVIAMQAGVALRILDEHPAAARASLEAIRATSTEALDGLRAEVQALRSGDPVAHAPLRPSSGLADLPELANRMRSSGLPVTVEAGDVGALSPEVDRAAYRIVQESLTNVLRHAGRTASASVRVARSGEELSVCVLDTGAGGPVPAGDSTGIDGMRLRAESLGGSLTAGPGPDGGFMVRASLPIERSSTVDGRTG